MKYNNIRLKFQVLPTIIIFNLQQNNLNHRSSFKY